MKIRLIKETSEMRARRAVCEPMSSLWYAAVRYSLARLEARRRSDARDFVPAQESCAKWKASREICFLLAVVVRAQCKVHPAKALSCIARASRLALDIVVSHRVRASCFVLASRRPTIVCSTRRCAPARPEDASATQRRNGTIGRKRDVTRAGNY